MKTIKNIFLGLLCLSAVSCTNELYNQQSKTKVTFSVDNFITNSTRSSVDPANNYAVTWASGDVIGIFPREGYQEPFSIPANQVGQSKATFDGGYWSMKEGLTYNAYYPFDKVNFESAESKTTIPVTYVGQSQTGTACNAGAFDYTYSDWTQASGGSINFKFHHLGAFLVLTLKIPATATYTSLTLNANSAVIPTKGTYDLTAASPAFVATENAKASSLTMTLNDFSGTAGEDATFYMMMPPCDLSSATLTVTLSTGSTSCYYTLESKNIQAAHLYKVTGTPKESSVNGTIDGWVAEEHEYVDLGLSVKWATCNIGAINPEDYGDYFAWGETAPKTSYSWSTYTLCNGSSSTMTKYCTDSSYGTVDNKTVLESSEDAATVNWGGNWRMPTYAEQAELITGCYGEWTSSYNSTGVAGHIVYKVKSDSDKGVWKHSDGSSSKNVTGSYSLSDTHIFLPAAGCRLNSSLNYAGSDGYYWSSSLSSSYATDAYNLGFFSSYVNWYYINRYRGQSVRPVCQ